jgi:hypothetical protein
MSRPLRIEFDGAVYHITARGDRRENIFEDDEDRLGKGVRSCLLPAPHLHLDDLSSVL